MFCLIYKNHISTFLIFIFLLQKVNQLESEIAKLEQKLSMLPCYSVIPKSFDQLDETDIISVRDIFNKAKQWSIDLENMEKRNYLKSDEYSSFLDDLLQVFSKTVLQQIKEDINDSHKPLICWLKRFIKAKNMKHT